MKNKNFIIAIITDIIAISILLSQMSWSLLGFFNFHLIVLLIIMMVQITEESVLLGTIVIFIGLWEIFSFKTAIILYIIIPTIYYTISYIIYKIIQIKKQRKMEQMRQRQLEKQREMEQMRQQQLEKQRKMEQMRQQQQIEKLKNTKIIIDSNIYMNDRYNELFDFFIKYQIQILMTSLQYDEIKNIKKSDKDENTKYAARNAMRIITELSKKKVLKIINKNFESNEKAYADPEIFKYALHFAKKHPVLVVTNDMDLINNIIHILNNPNIEVFDGDDFEKLINKLNFISYL
jgi:ABC-type multidrug transport system fused ATPase/permease subunit